MDFKEFEKLIPSLIPIILIIVVSWVFSFLAAKMKKTQQQKDESSSPAQGEDVLSGILNFGQGADVLRGSPEETTGRPGEMPPGQVSDWRTYRGSQGPRVSSDPIKPKWWGA